MVACRRGGGEVHGGYGAGIVAEPAEGETVGGRQVILGPITGQFRVVQFGGDAAGGGFAVFGLAGAGDEGGGERGGGLGIECRGVIGVGGGADRGGEGVGDGDVHLVVAGVNIAVTQRGVWRATSVDKRDAGGFDLHPDRLIDGHSRVIRC